MAVVGYARVSSEDQSLDLQIEQLRGAGCEKIFSEKRSGITTRDRTELERCLAWVREGDTLVITRIDRFARSVSDFSRMVGDLQARQIELRCLLQPFDTTSPQGRLMRDMLAAFAEFETAVRKERQLEGIKAAKERGVYQKGAAKNSQRWATASRMLREGATYEEVAVWSGWSLRHIRRKLPGYNVKNYPENRANPIHRLRPHPPSEAEALEMQGMTKGLGGEAKGPFWGRFKKP